jgi:protein-S-isoprenylcysteine O-methyltransferase Ste14
MKATSLEFRFRYLLHLMIYAIGFTAPWNLFLHYDTIRTWQLLAATLARAGWLGFSAATVGVLGAGIALAFVAAVVRTWAAAYLGDAVVHGGRLVGDSVVASGPYRYVRHPLYLGAMLHTLALVLLMPPTGAVFSIVATAVLLMRLIGAEEAFLTARLGESYAVYRAKVPSLLPGLRPSPRPSLRAHVQASTVRPRWVTAFAGEIYMWGAAASFASLGWRYNAQLVLQGVIVALGVALVARAFLPKQ